MTEDEMAGWHHRLNGHEFVLTPGVGDGQGGLAWCDAWDYKELDTTFQQSSKQQQWLHTLQFSSVSSVMSDSL